MAVPRMSVFASICILSHGNGKRWRKLTKSAEGSNTTASARYTDPKPTLREHPAATKTVTALPSSQDQACLSQPSLVVAYVRRDRKLAASVGSTHANSIHICYACTVVTNFLISCAAATYTKTKHDMPSFHVRQSPPAQETKP